MYSSGPIQNLACKNPMILKHGIEKAVVALVESLQKMSKKQVGDVLRVKIERNGKTIEFVYNAGQRP